MYCLSKLTKKIEACRGFTLIELLVAIAIVAILSVIGIVIFSSIQKTVRDTTRKADLNAIAKAYETTYASTGEYHSIDGSNFAGGKFPTPPEGGSYGGLIVTTATGFQVCAALEGNSGSCSTPSATCYCIQSSQGRYVPSGSPLPTPTSTPVSTPTPTPVSTATPTPTPTAVPAPACSFNGPLTLNVGEPGAYTSTSTGTIDTYFWEKLVGPINGTFSPSNIVANVDWSSTTAGSYTLQLTVTGPGGSDACQNATPITVNSAPTPTPTPIPTPIPTPTSTPTPTPAPAFQYVFITATATTGSLGGLSGADTKCQTDANNAGLSAYVFKAWLSDGTNSAAIRITNHSSLPYKMVNGVTVANNWTDLTDGTLQNAITITAVGGSITSGSVWTNTNADGTITGTGTTFTCNGSWSSGAGNKSGARGLVDSTGSTWTANGTQSCNSACTYLYCIQDP